MLCALNRPRLAIGRSFITYLRGSDAAPEVLKSAATSMKHLIDTQASDVYDKEVCGAAKPFVAPILTPPIHSARRLTIDWQRRRLVKAEIEHASLCRQVTTLALFS